LRQITWRCSPWRGWRRGSRFRTLDVVADGGLRHRTGLLEISPLAILQAQDNWLMAAEKPGRGAEEIRSRRTGLGAVALAEWLDPTGMS
jgi:hypothetical protein